MNSHSFNRTVIIIIIFIMVIIFDIIIIIISISNDRSLSIESAITLVRKLIFKHSSIYDSNPYPRCLWLNWGIRGQKLISVSGRDSNFQHCWLYIYQALTYEEMTPLIHVA